MQDPSNSAPIKPKSLEDKAAAILNATMVMLLGIAAAAFALWILGQTVGELAGAQPRMRWWAPVWFDITGGCTTLFMGVILMRFALRMFRSV